jgi:signal transduction histidine kinase
MSDVILESVRAFIMTLILGYLLWIGRREALHRQKGWLQIEVGFTLVLFGSLIDITDNYEGLNRYVVIGDTVTEALLEKVGGFLLGFSLILLGFLHWLPLVAAVRKNQEDLLKYNEELGAQVEARTADLTLTNERLLQEINNRENLAKSPSEDPNPVLRLALDGTILYANPASRSVMEDWRRETGEKAPEEWRNSVADVLDSNANTEIETEIKQRTISFILAPVIDSNYVNLYGRDVTAIKELDRMKDNFLSMVSHELRTPLTAIKSSAEILLVYEDIDKESERDFISIINSECDRLTRLINDIMDLSMIESGEYRWHISEVSIPEVIETAVNAARARLIEEELTLVCDIEPNMPSIQSDGDKLIQVMTNLIGNAIKFTPENGQIEVKAKFVVGDAAKDAPTEIHVSVSDTGIGISSEDHDEVFERFKQVSHSQFARPRGTGLGLPICNEIIPHLGGSISVESELGEGSTFSFIVPSYAE